ncbi:MAG: inorganic diphosphatase [Desulfobacteraceae bacterium]|nr:inorganic diphosphatase [Desulfobacteraceae bacterium]
MTKERGQAQGKRVGTKWVEVVIEVPRGSFVKRDGRGRVEFWSPLPCPVNYGSIVGSKGPDSDPLDAVVLGKRLPRGKRVKVPVQGAVGFCDQGVDDVKLVCSHEALTAAQRRRLLLFFRFYGACKRWVRFRESAGKPTFCQGWYPWPMIQTLW